MIGATVTSTEVMDAVRSTLQTWVPSVLAELVRRRTGTTYQAASTLPAFPWKQVQSWQEIPDEGVFHLASDRLPMVAVIPGSTVGMSRDAEGVHSVTWEMNVLTVIRGPNWAETTARLGIYRHAIVVALAQHRIGIASASKARWQAARANIVNPRKARNLQGGIDVFHIDVDGVMDDLAGPATPPAAPEYADPTLPTVGPDKAKVSVTHDRTVPVGP